MQAGKIWSGGGNGRLQEKRKLACKVISRDNFKMGLHLGQYQIQKGRKDIGKTSCEKEGGSSWEPKELKVPSPLP